MSVSSPNSEISMVYSHFFTILTTFTKAQEVQQEPRNNKARDPKECH